MQKQKPNNAISKKEIKVHNSVDNGIEIPATALPVKFGGDAFTLVDGYNYIPFFAPLDNLFRTLLELRLLSPTQGNCINDKVFYSVGDGLQVQDKVFPPAFDKKINGERETIDDTLKCTFESLYQDGNSFIEIVCTEVAGEKFVHVYSHNNMDCRFEERKDGSNPTHVLRSRQFRRDGIYNITKEDKPVRIPLWSDMVPDPEKVWKKDRDGVTKRTIIHIKNKVKGIDHYGLPTNFSGLYQTLLEYKSTRFNLDNFDNNMFLGGVLMIQGNLSSTEEKKLTQGIRKMHTGEGKAMRVVPISAEQGITDSKFIPFSESHEGHFIEFDKHNEEKIIGANGWSRALLDMKDGGSLGKGGEYLKQLFKMKFHTVIKPAQQVVLNNFIFPLMKIIDEHKGTKFYDMPWCINPVIPITLEGMLDVNSLLTVDEGREEISKKPLGGEVGKKMISEVKAKPKEEKKEKKKKEEEK